MYPVARAGANLCAVGGSNGAPPPVPALFARGRVEDLLGRTGAAPPDQRAMGMRLAYRNPSGCANRPAISCPCTPRHPLNRQKPAANGR